MIVEHVSDMLKRVKNFVVVPCAEQHAVRVFARLLKQRDESVCVVGAEVARSIIVKQDASSLSIVNVDPYDSDLCHACVDRSSECVIACQDVTC